MDYTLLTILLKDLVILPFQEIKLELKDEISKKIIKISNKKYDGRVLVASPHNTLEEDLEIDDLPKVGVVSYIKSEVILANGNVRVTLRGEKRVKVLNYESFSSDTIAANVTDIDLPKIDNIKETVLIKKLRELTSEYISSSPNVSNSIMKTINDSDDLGFITDAITTFLNISVSKKIGYMEEINKVDRAMALIQDIEEQIEYAKLEDKIDEELTIKLSKEQEEFYLKEKLKEIESTLGINSKKNIEVKEYTKLLKELKLDSKVRDKIENEIKKLELSPESSPEVVVIRTYLDWMLNLPWNVSSKENTNVRSVTSSLNKSHYGLTKVKERILDYVSIKNINPDIPAPVICLVGPPGVGKTTISKSIAKSLGREFAKISVGGLNDGTELIGSRRTYLGALPGKFIQAIKKCGTNNPVILIDEVDKMVKDYKGDPASILLDILDTNQNSTFTDNYLEEEFSLNNVMFILTANNIEDIPYTLADRLEIIPISSYTVFEKIDIAKKYIIPKIIDEFNVAKKITIADKTLHYIVDNYTKEAGVRNLERILKTLIIKALTNNKTNITLNDVKSYLEVIEKNELSKVEIPGIVNALAYTPLGGKTIQVETTLYEGNDIIVTGSLGDVLKESINVSISYIKSNDYVDNSIFKNNSVHVHLLDNATKKEGPSCGVAITTSIISMALNKCVPSDIAFTGEISLKGRILKVGGIKEKLIAAYNSDIKTVYIPMDNKEDLVDIPKQIIDNIEIKFANNYKYIFEDIFK